MSAEPGRKPPSFMDFVDRYKLLTVCIFFVAIVNLLVRHWFDAVSILATPVLLWSFYRDGWSDGVKGFARELSEWWSARRDGAM